MSSGSVLLARRGTLGYASPMAPLSVTSHDLPLADLLPEVPEQRDLLAHWRDLRGSGEKMPSRHRFDPMAVPRQLPFMMLLDRPAADGSIMVRLMGTRLAEHYKQDLTGRNLLSGLAADIHPQALALYSDVLETPCVSLIHRPMLRVSGARLQVEALHLPLAAGDGRPTFVLSTFRSRGGRLDASKGDPVNVLESVAVTRWRGLL